VQSRRSAFALLVFLSLGMMVTSVEAESHYIKVEIKGSLRTGIMASGGETTGTTITVKGRGPLEVTWELDLGSNKEFRDMARKLHGKTALVVGTYSKRRGVEVRERHIVEVTSLKEPPPK